MVTRIQFAIARLTPRKPAALLMGSAAPVLAVPRTVSLVTGGRALPVQSSAPWWATPSIATAAAITRDSMNAYRASHRRPRGRLAKARAHFARVARNA